MVNTLLRAAAWVLLWLLLSSVVALVFFVTIMRWRFAIQALLRLWHRMKN